MRCQFSYDCSDDRDVSLEASRNHERHILIFEIDVAELEGSTKMLTIE
jgi:hypothetical protein